MKETVASSTGCCISKKKLRWKLANIVRAMECFFKTFSGITVSTEVSFDALI